MDSDVGAVGAVASVAASELEVPAADGDEGVAVMGTSGGE